MPRPKKNSSVVNRKITFGVLLALAGTMGMALLSSVEKIILLDNGMPLHIAFWRGVIGVIIFWLIGLVFMQKTAILKTSPKLALFSAINGAIGIYGATVLATTAIPMIGAALVVLLMSCFPVLVVIIDSIITRKTPSGRVMSIIGVILLGIYFLIGGVDISTLYENGNGTLWALSGMTCAAIYTTVKSRLIQSLHNVSYLSYTMLGALIAATAHTYQIESFTVAMESNSAFFYTILASLIFCTGIMFFAMSIKALGVIRFVIIVNSMPVFAMIFAYVIHGEVLSYWQLLGAGIVITAIIALEREALRMFARKIKALFMPIINKT